MFRAAAGRMAMAAQKGHGVRIRRFAGRIGGLVRGENSATLMVPGHKKAERRRVPCTATKRLGIDFA